jgi:hypothetical protein
VASTGTGAAGRSIGWADRRDFWHLYRRTKGNAELRLKRMLEEIGLKPRDETVLHETSPVSNQVRSRHSKEPILKI